MTITLEITLHPEGTATREEICQYIKNQDALDAKGSEIARLTARVNEHEEAEAAVCPEDVGCIEYIKALTARLAECVTREYFLEITSSLQARLAEVERDRDTYVVNLSHAQADIAAEIAEQDTLRADLAATRAVLRRLYDAIDTCLGGRGAYSCSPPHDCRCDKDRKISEECVCGADDLAAILADPALAAALEEGS